MASSGLVLIHGGGFDARCWDHVVPLLETDVEAVDLPGRGRHAVDPRTVSFEDCARSVVGDVEARGFERVVLVGHSLAGCSMPSIAAALGDRVLGLVFVACTVPEEGRSAIDTLDASVQALARSMPRDLEPAPLSGEMAARVLGSDLTAAQVAWCLERTVAEAPALSFDPISLVGLRSASAPRWWIRTLRDEIVPADRQLRFAANVGECEILDIDAGHMAMVSHPELLADLLDGIVAELAASEG
jgi:pimeloyl-ACP methyl ester carboxylesterase